MAEKTPTSHFNSLTEEGARVTKGVNADINRAREKSFDKAMAKNGVGDGAPETVSTDALKAAAPPASGIQFETGPDPKREALRRQGPPAAMLNRHIKNE